MKLFPIERSLDYTVTQKFLVLAKNEEKAMDKVNKFCNESNWSSDAARKHGVVQVGDEMEQIENSEKFSTNGIPVPADTAAIGDSMAKLTLENEASAMFAMLKKIAETPQMFCAGYSDLGFAAKTLLEAIQSKLDEPASALAAVIKK